MHHSLQNLSVFNLSPRNAASGHIQFKGDRVSSQLPESNRRTRLCPFSCCVSAGLPRQGEKMLLHSLMRKKPDNFLSFCHLFSKKHTYIQKTVDSMFRRRGCKEKPPFLQIFFSFCCGQQNGGIENYPLYFFGCIPQKINCSLITLCSCQLKPSSCNHCLILASASL